MSTLSYSHSVLGSFLLATHLLSPCTHCFLSRYLLLIGLDSISIPVILFNILSCNKRAVHCLIKRHAIDALQVPCFPLRCLCMHMQSHPQHIHIPFGIVNLFSFTLNLPINSNSHIAVPSPDPAYNVARSPYIGKACSCLCSVWGPCSSASCTCKPSVEPSGSAMSHACLPSLSVGSPCGSKTGMCFQLARLGCSGGASSMPLGLPAPMYRQWHG
jgi:hypothetical protein